MIRRLIALCAVMATVCLGARAQVPAGFIRVVQTGLQDSTGTKASNVTVCAQAKASGQPVSVRVGAGYGVTVTRPVCVLVVSGFWSMNLPDGAQSAPLNPAWELTATDNLTGENLLAGYTSLQPHSQTCTVSNGGGVSCVPNSLTDWCAASGCIVDKQPPNALAQSLIVQGVKGDSGIPGAQGLPGCLLTTGNCTNVVSAVPTADQMCGDSRLCVAPTGDTGARINAFLNGLRAAGKIGGEAVLLGNAQVAMTTEIVLPVQTSSSAGGGGFRVSCSEGAGWTYAGTGRAVSIGEGASNWSHTGIDHCHISGTGAGIAGISTAGGALTLGWSSSYNLVDGFTHGSACEFTGNAVAGISTYDTCNASKYGINLTGSSFSGTNAWTIIHPQTGGNSKWGIYVPYDTGAPQTLHIIDHVSEGDGLSADADSGCALFETVQNGSYDNPYCEPQSVGGLTGVRIGKNGVAGYVADFTLNGGIYALFGGSDIIVAGTNTNGVTVMGNITFSGAEAANLKIEAGPAPLRVMSDGLNIVLAPGAAAPFVTSTRYKQQSTIADTSTTMMQFQFPIGACTAFSPAVGSPNWSAVFRGEFLQNGQTYATTPYGVPISSTNPTITVGGMTATVSKNSNNQLCMTPTGTGLLFLSGTVSVVGTIGTIVTPFTGQCTSPHIPVFKDGIATACSTSP